MNCATFRKSPLRPVPVEESDEEMVDEEEMDEGEEEAPQEEEDLDFLYAEWEWESYPRRGVFTRAMADLTPEQVEEVWRASDEYYAREYNYLEGAKLQEEF